MHIICVLATEEFTVCNILVTRNHTEYTHSSNYTLFENIMMRERDGVRPKEDEGMLKE